MSEKAETPPRRPGGMVNVQELGDYWRAEPHRTVIVACVGSELRGWALLAEDAVTRTLNDQFYVQRAFVRCGPTTLDDTCVRDQLCRFGREQAEDDIDTMWKGLVKHLQQKGWAKELAEDAVSETLTQRKVRKAFDNCGSHSLLDACVRNFLKKVARHKASDMHRRSTGTRRGGGEDREEPVVVEERVEEREGRNFRVTILEPAPPHVPVDQPPRIVPLPPGFEDRFEADDQPPSEPDWDWLLRRYGKTNTEILKKRDHGATYREIAEAYTGDPPPGYVLRRLTGLVEDLRRPSWFPWQDIARGIDRGVVLRDVEAELERTGCADQLRSYGKGGYFEPACHYLSAKATMKPFWSEVAAAVNSGLLELGSDKHWSENALRQRFKRAKDNIKCFGAWFRPDYEDLVLK